MNSQVGKTKNVVNGRKVCDVSDIPYYPPGVRIPREDVLLYGLDSVYRMMFARGQGGSRRDPTWNGKKHVCCGCKYPWRHFMTCTKAIRNAPDDLSDLVEQASHN